MSVFKCKMCGGTLEINNNETVATCEYCGTKQTLPKLDDEKRANLYDRANHFRRNNEFDKASAVYEQILNEDSADAEAYWSLVLCHYGIEYVEDPSTHKRVPTVNRAQFTSIFDDDNYKSALQYADGYQKTVYEEEAKSINEIQKGILAISQKEDPFDVFICYKETDNGGRRTPDSVLANDLYHQLTQENFKVFFARITLEDKLGSAYEPYIFAALNSAKVMVVLGTKPEYFNAVWVKNEWSRYLTLVKQSAGKKILIPAYKDMDPYDLPEEFSHLQAQDMSKLGFMQDLIRGIRKIVGADTQKTTVVKETVATGGNANTAPLLRRAFMFLSDGNWQEADEYCEKVLDQDPENAEAYLGKLMAELHVKKEGDIADCNGTLTKNNIYNKIMLFGNEELKSKLCEYDTSCKYNYAVSVFNERRYELAKQLFEELRGYKDSENRITECIHNIEQIKIEQEKQRVEAEQAKGKIAELKKKYIPPVCLMVGGGLSIILGMVLVDSAPMIGPFVRHVGIICVLAGFICLAVVGPVLLSKINKKLRALNGKTNPSVKSTPINSVDSSPFRMSIDQCFFITGRGTIITGNILSGTVFLNDTLMINGAAYQVSAIESFRKMVFCATAGMNVGLLISKSSIKFEKGTIVTSTSASPMLESSDRFTVKLIDPGINILEIIKMIRELTGLGLAESKQLSEFVPSIIATVDSADTANKIKVQFEAAGARVEIE